MPSIVAPPANIKRITTKDIKNGAAFFRPPIASIIVARSRVGEIGCSCWLSGFGSSSTRPIRDIPLEKRKGLAHSSN